MKGFCKIVVFCQILGSFMSEFGKNLIERFYKISPYQDFDPTTYSPDIQGWGSYHPLFQEIIHSTKPQLILEVGTWKGASAIHMASLLRKENINGAIICIDTWLGGIENLSDDKISGINQLNHHGYPTLYYQFLANVIHSKVEDYIIPLPNTSNIIAKYLKSSSIQADFIYIDGSHDEDDVYTDLNNYWQLLKPGGIMMGDDWYTGWYSVICAVNRFAKENQLEIAVTDEKWVLKKA